MYFVSQLVVLISLAGQLLAQQKYEFEFSSPQRKCADDEKIAVGDLVSVIADGFLRDGTQFYSNDTIQFQVGERGSRVPKAYHRTLKGQCLAQKVIMVIPPRLGYERGRPSVIPEDATMWHIVIITSIVRIPSVLRSGDLNKYQKISQLVRNPQNCVEEDKAKIGDRLIVNTQGFREDRTMFVDEDVNFVLGIDKHVLVGWDQGLVGRCVGEVVEIVIPGKQILQDKTLLGRVILQDESIETIVSVVRINAIIRQNTTGGCADPAKVQPNLYVDLAIKAKIMTAKQPSSEGRIFFEKSSYQSRFGEDKTGVKRGIEDGMEGACDGDRRVVLIGPKLGYGHEGNKAFRNNKRSRGAVPPGTNIRIEARVNNVSDNNFS